jgi:hypothetical protein
MSPHRLIEGAAFEPEVVALMIRAYDAAVKRIGKDQPPLVLETVARRIIDNAGSGERDPQKLVEYAVLGVAPFPNVG